LICGNRQSDQLAGSYFVGIAIEVKGLGFGGKKWELAKGSWGQI